MVAVYNQAGTKLISYKYDAFGSFTATTHVAGTTANNNPFRYRGYYYDNDLGLYYLNSRYYDSNTGRLISADNALYHSMLGYNMYVYCNNNPINFVDHSGESATAILGFLEGLWGVAFAEPTPIGEIVAGVATVVGAGIGIYYAVEEITDFIGYLSQANKKDDASFTTPQSITDSKEEAVDSSPTINEVKDTQKDSTYKGKKVAPRIKSNNKKTAREKAFFKGGKRPPIHHPNGKFCPHFHPNNPKFSHWHYYYILVFSASQLEQEG